jgi:exodeoxyribonuclease V gamma subunit
VLIVHRSERADRLVDALAQLVADPLDDPVTAEIVSVPTRGVERWITQCLSHVLGSGPAGGDGVCANLDFPFPATLVAGAGARATGVDPAVDPWAPPRLVWPMVEAIDDSLLDDAMAPLVRHLMAATPPPRLGRSPALPEDPSVPPRLRRLATARHVADLFDHYSVHRPEMIQGWAAGGDDGAPGPAGWQPHLWRRLRRRLAVPSPAERMEEAAARIRSEPSVLDLPERLSLFGLTRLPPAHLTILDAIASSRDVHLFVLHPSGCLWDRTAPLVGPGPVTRRAEDATARLPRHPLLRSWGRDSRELQSVLAAAGGGNSVHYPVDEPARPTLLGRIQAAVRADVPPPGPAGDRAAMGRADRSVQIHSCHGRMRQVEVLRDAILHLLQDFPSLEARDVIVMCPDIETFAPLIQAAFGVGGGEPPGSGGPVLRVRLADRSLRQTNPLLSVAADLLDLAASRVSAPAVVDLMARPPVSRRFGFDQEDLAVIERWVAGTAVRWGIDAAHRRPWNLDGVDANTWAWGLDRLMLGVAMAETECRTFAATLPYDDMTSTQVDLAGRFAEMVNRLGGVIDRLTTTQPLADWIEALVQGTEMLAGAAPDEVWQHDEIRASLGEVADLAVGPDLTGSDRTGPDLTLDEVRSLLGIHLQGRPTRANFRTGDLTICTLVPMRSVPHRVVALLGLDDGAFPRQPDDDGDDLLALDRRVGDRDPRSEDRQLLLDAVLAAGDQLIITYCGRDERTNRYRPPCAPVAELLDVIDATVVAPDGQPARSAVVVAHPLQPFDPRNFENDVLRPGGPWGFDPVFRDGAVSASSPARPAVEEPPLPALTEPVLQVEQLVGFVQHPIRAFLRRRLSLYLGDWTEDLDDRLPLELDALARWGLGDRLLEAVLAGVDLDQAAQAEQKRGLLPPGALAARVLQTVGPGVEALAAAVAARGFPPGPSQAAQVLIELPDGRTLSGSVPQVRGETIVTCTFSRLAAKHRLAAWVRFLALSADRPERPIAALTVGRGSAPGSVAVATLAPLPGPPDERRRLAQIGLRLIVDLYDRGMTEPLPLVCGASAAWVEGRRLDLSEDQVLDRASKVWQSSGDIPGERDQAEHEFVYGRWSDIRCLLSAPPRPDESGAGWTGSEPHRFGRLARRLWDPLLVHESMADG